MVQIKRSLDVNEEYTIKFIDVHGNTQALKAYSGVDNLLGPEEVKQTATGGLTVVPISIMAGVEASKAPATNMMALTALQKNNTAVARQKSRLRHLRRFKDNSEYLPDRQIFTTTPLRTNNPNYSNNLVQPITVNQPAQVGMGFLGNITPVYKDTTERITGRIHVPGILAKVMYATRVQQIKTRVKNKRLLSDILQPPKSLGMQIAEEMELSKISGRYKSKRGMLADMKGTLTRMIQDFDADKLPPTLQRLLHDGKTEDELTKSLTRHFAKGVVNKTVPQIATSSPLPDLSNALEKIKKGNSRKENRDKQRLQQLEAKDRKLALAVAMGQHFINAVDRTKADQAALKDLGRGLMKFKGELTADELKADYDAKTSLSMHEKIAKAAVEIEPHRVEKVNMGVKRKVRMISGVRSK